MADRVQRVSIRGRQQIVGSIPVSQDVSIVVTGNILKIGKIHDEVWQESKDMIDPAKIIEVLRKSRIRPDVFTFVQKLPDVTPKYSYKLEWDNYAVAHFESYSEWFEKQIDRNTKKNIRKFAKEGVSAEVVPFTDELVEGICTIYNELKIRQGREFWHYGKDFATVKSENSSYLDRSVFIGAYYEKELIGFLKIVFDGQVANLMQILSKMAYHEKRPTNALLSKAVEICETRGAKYLTYGEYVYGKKEESTLIEFKRKNGFKKVDVPRYYIPLTLKGNMALYLGLHKGIKEWLPASISYSLLKYRAIYYELTSSKQRKV